MPTVRAHAPLAAGTAHSAWLLATDGARLPSIAEHVLEVTPLPPDQARWRVLLNGSQVGWVQRLHGDTPGELRFEQTSGDLDQLRGRWSTDGTRLELEIEFELGVDGLAPLLDPIWAQSFQAHADALVRAVTAAAAREHA